MLLDIKYFNFSMHNEQHIGKKGNKHKDVHFNTKYQEEES